MTSAPPTPPRGHSLLQPGMRKKTLTWLIPVMVLLVSAALTVPLLVLDHNQDRVEDEDGPEPAGLCKVLPSHALEQAFRDGQLRLAVLHEGPGPIDEQRQVRMQNNGTIYSKCEYRDRSTNSLDALLLKGIYSANMWTENDVVQDTLSGMSDPVRIGIPGVDVAYYAVDASQDGGYEVDAVDADAMGDYVVTILWVSQNVGPTKSVLIGIVNQLT
jgi:hypothetical protein